MRLVQFAYSGDRRVGVVDGDTLRLVEAFDSVYALALHAIENNRPLKEVIEKNLGSNSAVYSEDLEFLPSFDHPRAPAACLVSGTGLTHRKSAQTRDSMHTGAHTVTDSMKMYEWGVEGGRPAPGRIGTQPEWFYKGNGYLLRAHRQSLDIPAYGDDGGDEGEIAGCYVIDHAGQPRRVGFTAGNEFSDHVMERKNYLYLAPSKLRQCAIGPELVIDAAFEDIRGLVRVERGGKEIWRKELATGEAHMCHSLANMEHHHFKYAAHRQPGDAHIHFFGTGAFSFGEVKLEEGDVMEISFEGFGRPLRNALRVDKTPLELVRVTAV